MKYRAEIDIMPLEELLDPQGKTVRKNLVNVGIAEVSKVRVGKHIKMQFEAENEEQAKEKVRTSCEKLFANLITESFTFDLFPE